MRPQSPSMKEYIQLREEVLGNIPDNVDVFTIRTRILENTRFATKRRVERIKSIKELVKELGKFSKEKKLFTIEEHPSFPHNR